MTHYFIAIALWKLISCGNSIIVNKRKQYVNEIYEGTFLETVTTVSKKAVQLQYISAKASHVGYYSGSPLGSLSDQSNHLSNYQLESGLNSDLKLLN